MKVKCTTFYNKYTKEHEKESNWITIGKEYIVLGVEIRQDRISYLIPSDEDQMPVLENAIQFEIISGKILSNWKIVPYKIKFFFMRPGAWCKPGFMEACYDLDPEALKIYKRETKIMYEEEGML